MRKTIALLLSLLLAFGLFAPGLAESAAIISGLKDTVDEFFRLKDYQFDYDAQRESYKGEFSMDSALGSCEVYVYLYDDMISCTADVYNLKVPEAYRDNMAIFLTLANSNLYYANLFMIYEAGHVYTRSYIYVESVMPSVDEVNTLIQQAVVSLDEWGDGIVKVLTGADPHQTYQEIQAAQQNQSNSF